MKMKWPRSRVRSFDAQDGQEADSEASRLAIEMAMERPECRNPRLERPACLDPRGRGGRCALRQMCTETWRQMCIKTDVPWDRCAQRDGDRYALRCALRPCEAPEKSKRLSDVPVKLHSSVVDRRSKCEVHFGGQ